MMRPGSILLDVVISSLIGGVVIIMLMSSMAQLVKFDTIVQESSLLMQQLVVIQHQLEKDLSGVFIPYKGTLQEQKKEQPGINPSAGQNQQSKNESTENVAGETAQEQSNEQKGKPLEQLFVATKDAQNQLASLTFITNNPLAAYWQGTVGTPQPKRVRVVYTLQKEPERKDSYQLLRQEGSDLLFETYKKNNSKAPRAYVVLDHIKSFKVQFGYEEKVKKQETKAPSAPNAPAVQKQAEKTPETTFKKVDTWDSKVTTQKDSLYVSRIPHVIYCTLELWNDAYTHSHTFTITIPMLAHGFNALVQPPKPAPQQPVEKQQGPQTKAPTQAQPPQQQMEEKVFKLMINEHNQPILVASDAPPRKKIKKIERSTRVVNNHGKSFFNFNKLVNQ